jgi:hypothetical protein
MTPSTYLLEIKAKLASSPAVVTVTVTEEYTLVDQGYFRARLTLSNSDFLEIAEYFAIENDQSKTKRYRYQWMDETQQILKKRWDNVEHFPDLSNFPHHIHVGAENQVEPGHSLNILHLIELIEQELSFHSDNSTP